jgi:hypothetical protein
MAWSWTNLKRQRREIGRLHEGNYGEFGLSMPCLVALAELLCSFMREDCGTSSAAPPKLSLGGCECEPSYGKLTNRNVLFYFHMAFVIPANDIAALMIDPWPISFFIATGNSASPTNTSRQFARLQ